MSLKPLTQLEFFSIPVNVISEKDKKLIEKCVWDMGGGYDESADLPLRCIMRAWAAKLWREMEPDRRLRKDISGMLSCFADGWTAANNPIKKEKKDG